MNSSPTADETADRCAAQGWPLSAWHRTWVANWVAAGRPKGLYQQYRLEPDIATV
jgi:hypothetical protein